MKIAKNDYTCAPQLRILEVLRVLAGNEFTGLTPGEIATALKIQPPMVTRDLFNLEESGFAEKIPETNRWRLGPRLVQIGLAFTLHIDKQESRLAEIKGRYTRLPG